MGDSLKLPTVEEALAYADGYQSGLDAAENKDGAAAISEIDVLNVDLAFCRAMRLVAERERDEAKARLVSYKAMQKALSAIAGETPWPDSEMGFVDLARSTLKSVS